jgi:hypothetical protein
MPAYAAAFSVTIEADNQRDAFDALDAFLDAVSAQTATFGITLMRPAFEDVRHAD